MRHRKHDPWLVYDFIVAHKRAHDGNSPSLREIAKGCGIGEVGASIVHILARLERDGLIRIDHGASGVGQARHIVVVGGQWKLNGWKQEHAPT